MSFRQVIMVNNQPEIARVNRKTGVLYLNSDIWDKLPTDQKEFVLLHEKGHLKLNTNNEFRANAYAVKNYVPVDTFSNAELGKRIVVMRSILDKADDHLKPRFTDALIAGASSGLISNILQSLPVLGIGSDSRVKETKATAQAQQAILGAQSEIEEEKAKQRQKILVLAGVLAIVGLIIYLTLKK